MYSIHNCKLMYIYLHDPQCLIGIVQLNYMNIRMSSEMTNKMWNRSRENDICEQKLIDYTVQ